MHQCKICKGQAGKVRGKSPANAPKAGRQFMNMRQICEKRAWVVDVKLIEVQWRQNLKFWNLPTACSRQPPHNSTPSPLCLPTGIFFFTVPRTRMWKAEFIWSSTPGHLTCSRHGIVGTLRENERNVLISKSSWTGSKEWILAIRRSKTKWSVKYGQLQGFLVRHPMQCMRQHLLFAHHALTGPWTNIHQHMFAVVLYTRNSEADLE